MEPEADGSLDKHRLLQAIRNVSFDGATGRVAFDERGERDGGALPLLMKNIRPVVGSDGEVTLSEVVTWKWYGGEGRLDAESERAPIWPGGAEAWELPIQVQECGPGLVFSVDSLQCEPCPAGEGKEGSVCVRYDAFVGVLVPMGWGSVSKGYAASIIMAARHINQRIDTLVPHARELLPA
eukprot:337869-Rhodomonas_salina.1